MGAVERLPRRLGGEAVKYLCEMVGGVVLGFAWLAGIVLASGFWSTFIACVFPFWAWYLVVEKVLIVWGVK